MVNMFSIGPSMMGGMNTNTGNVHQKLKNKYGVGYEDFNRKPYLQPYPMAITPPAPRPNLENTWLGRLIRKCYF